MRGPGARATIPRMRFGKHFSRRVGAGTSPVLGSDAVPAAPPSDKSNDNQLSWRANNVNGFPIQRVAVGYRCTVAGSSLVATLYVYDEDSFAWFLASTGLLTLGTVTYLDVPVLSDSVANSSGGLEMCLVVAAAGGDLDGTYTFSIGADLSNDGSSIVSSNPAPVKSPDHSTDATFTLPVWVGTIASGPVALDQAPSPLVQNGAAFDNATWTKTRSSIVANAAVDPLGTSLADRLIEDATGGSTHLIQQTIAPMVASVAVTVSVYVKAETRSWVYIGDAAGPGAGNPGAYFNVGAGVLGTVTGTGATASITAAANGYFLCSLTGINPNQAFHLRLATGDGVSSYNGDGVSSVLLFGASVAGLTVPANRILRMTAKRDAILTMGSCQLRIVTAGDGTSMVFQAWFYDNTQAQWVKLAGPITVTSATSNLGAVVVGDMAGAKFFVQATANTGGVSAFGYDFI